MKTLVFNLSAAFLMLFSVSAMADDKIMISGEPVTLEMHDNVYHLPENYSVTTDYHYVTIDNTRRVCYADIKPALATLNVMTVDVVVGGEKQMWHCYEFNPTYFTVTTTP